MDRSGGFSSFEVAKLLGSDIPRQPFVPIIICLVHVSFSFQLQHHMAASRLGAKMEQFGWSRHTVGMFMVHCERRAEPHPLRQVSSPVCKTGRYLPTLAARGGAKA